MCSYILDSYFAGSPKLFECVLFHIVFCIAYAVVTTIRPDMTSAALRGRMSRNQTKLNKLFSRKSLSSGKLGQIRLRAKPYTLSLGLKIWIVNKESLRLFKFKHILLYLV